MKLLFLFFVLAEIIVACHHLKKSQLLVVDDMEQIEEFETGVRLEAKQDCATCHSVKEKLIAPSYKQIAERYSNSNEIVISKLADKIIMGGKGNWGKLPMTPHLGLSVDSAKAIVKYILLIKIKS